MMARSRGSQIEISMFPFLSVLCTVIGVLMLMIVLVITTRAEEAAEAVTVAPAPVFEVTPSDELLIPEEDYRILRAHILQLGTQLEARQREIVNVNNLILELEDLIATKEDTSLQLLTGEGIIRGTTLGQPEDVDFVPLKNALATGSPHYIEISLDYCVAQPGNERFAVSELESAESNFRKFLANAHRRRAESYLVFLIHENGIATYDQVAAFVGKHYPGLKTGKEPFSRSWMFVRDQASPPNP